MNEMELKEEKLVQWFTLHPRLLIALSGGVDSCLLAYMARKTLGKENAIAVIGVSPALRTRDHQLAVDFCAAHDIDLIEIKPNEINDPHYATNPVNRCYFCKTSLYRSMHLLREQKFSDFHIVNGNNVSDMGDYRPGLRAAEEQGALNPLAQCGLEKEDIRSLARNYSLSVWDKPASPCLSSRFPYGERITVDRLHMIEMAENLLNDHGFRDVRVRYMSGMAMVEVPHNEIAILETMMGHIRPEIITLGFTDCEVDPEGLVSGKLNRGVVKSA